MSDFWNDEPTEAAQEDVLEEVQAEQVEEAPKVEEEPKPVKAEAKPAEQSFIFKRGDAGVHVRKMQESLATLGYEVPRSGRFCARTESELKKAQKALGLEENGLLDGPTCSAICS
jgi:N-acetyl-anhydromuramyl-L-alanine amidase AmpD